MKPTFVSGRKNLALTVMVPFDCPNNCPFCESKKEYAKNRPNPKAVINSIVRFFRDNNTLNVPEVVITGGEPMINLETLREIINAIPSDKDVYINTTLLRHQFNAFADLVNNTNKVKGINVSRHGHDYKEDCEMLHGIAPDNWLCKIKKTVRINCVVSNNTNIYEIIDRWVWHRNIELSLRENFNTMTEEELHNPYSSFLPRLATEFHYVGHTQCKVCDTTIFRAKRGGLVVRYHKGVKNTLVPLGNDKYEINDIIIRQDGEIFADWDFSNKTLLPTMLLHDGTKEVMERSRQRMVEIASTPYHICGGGCGGGVNYTPRFSCGGIACENGNPYPYSCGGYTGGSCG